MDTPKNTTRFTSGSLTEDQMRTRESDVLAFERGRYTDGSRVNTAKAATPTSLDPCDVHNTADSKTRQRERKAAKKSAITDEEKKKFNAYVRSTDPNDPLELNADGLTNKTSPLWFFFSVIATAIGTVALTATAVLLPPALGGWSIHADTTTWVILGICTIVAAITIYILSGSGTKTTTHPLLRVTGTVFVTTLLAMALFTAAIVTMRIVG